MWPTKSWQEKNCFEWILDEENQRNKKIYEKQWHKMKVIDKLMRNYAHE